MSYPNDDFASATVLTGTSGSIIPFHYDGIGDPASNEPGEFFIGAGETLWWVWTVPFTGRAFVTTRFSPSDGGGGLDTMMQAFIDFATLLDGNDDDRDAPVGSYRANSYLAVDAAAGDTIYFQVDQYGSGQAGTLHLSWGQETPDPSVPTVGSWIAVSETSLDEEVQDAIDVGGDRVYDAHLFVSEGGTWDLVAEGTGIASGLAHTPPKRPSYAVFAYMGEYNTGDWADTGIPAPDEYAIELNPFDLDWSARVAAILMPAPSLPPGAVGFEYQGYPMALYGMSYRPHLRQDWVSASSIRATLEINRVTLTTGDVEQTADAGWTWITTPVAGTTGPQHVVFRYDGPGLFSDAPFIRFDLGWNGPGYFTSTLTASTIVDDTYAIFDAVIEVGPDEVITWIDAGYISGTEHVHWSTPYDGGWSDYEMADVPSAGDHMEFAPEAMTVQLRMLDIDGGSLFRSGTVLAAAPLLFEYATAGTLNETVDTDWIDLDPAHHIPSGVYLNYAEQISHTSPEPGTLPARAARHHHVTTAEYQTGPTVVYGSTVAFERPDSTGSYERMRWRLTYQPPRHRFVYPGVSSTIPPLRQFPRNDGLRRTPGRSAATSRQGSLRRGPRGTYT